MILFGVYWANLDTTVINWASISQPSVFEINTSQTSLAPTLPADLTNVNLDILPFKENSQLNTNPNTMVSSQLDLNQVQGYSSMPCLLPAETQTIHGQLSMPFLSNCHTQGFNSVTMDVLNINIRRSSIFPLIMGHFPYMLLRWLRRGR
jgi:hypothetical protein